MFEKLSRRDGRPAAALQVVVVRPRFAVPPLEDAGGDERFLAQVHRDGVEAPHKVHLFTQVTRHDRLLKQRLLVVVGEVRQQRLVPLCRDELSQPEQRVICSVSTTPTHIRYATRISPGYCLYTDKAKDTQSHTHTDTATPAARCGLTQRHPREGDTNATASASVRLL